MKTRKSRDDDTSCLIDKSRRTIYVIGEVTHKMASRFRRMVHSLDTPDSSKPEIIVEINSPGGDIEAGLMMIDTIDLARCPVITRVTGVAYSMGSMILVAGKRREALPNSIIMVHEGAFWLHGRFAGLDAEYSEAVRLEALCWKIMDERTKQPAGFWKEKCGPKNLYLTAEQAQELRVVDKICGKG